MATITIDGVEYDTDKLSDEAKQQIANIRACEAHLAQLQREQAFAQTARQAYAAAIKDALANPN